MGTCKLLLPWGKKTVLAHLFDQWRRMGVAQVAPVIDASNELLKNVLVNARFSSSQWIENPFPERGMFSSLQEASRWSGWRSGLTHWVIVLGDQPQIKIFVLRLLLKTARQNPTRICQPVFNGRAGHPIIIPADQFLALAKSDDPDFRAFVRQHEDLRLRIPVDDAAVTSDLDTPSDYARWNPV
jgi:molybdenum cofactor cytidylyltransferase